MPPKKYTNTDLAKDYKFFAPVAHMFYREDSDDVVDTISNYKLDIPSYFGEHQALPPKLRLDESVKGALEVILLEGRDKAKKLLKEKADDAMRCLLADIKKRHKSKKK